MNPGMGTSDQFICCSACFAGTKEERVARHPWERMMLWYPGVPLGTHQSLPSPTGKNLLSSKENAVEKVLGFFCFLFFFLPVACSSLIQNLGSQSRGRTPDTAVKVPSPNH